MSWTHAGVILVLLQILPLGATLQHLDGSQNTAENRQESTCQHSQGHARARKAIQTFINNFLELKP